MTEIVAPLQAQRLAQNTKLLTYQQTALTAEAADHAVMEMYRRDVIGVRSLRKELIRRDSIHKLPE